jgi:hypothetical protein
MFVFDVTTKAGAQGRIQVQALDWSQSGPVSFQCDSDELALVLLSGCRCDAVGYFNLLGEEINENDNSLVTGRMSNNTLVHFPGDASLVGKLVNVSLDECHGFYYMGHMVQS